MTTATKSLDTIFKALDLGAISANSGRKADAIACVNVAIINYRKLPRSFRPDAKAMLDGFMAAHGTFIRGNR